MIRRKYVSLTPEEWVRQHLLHYLVEQKKIPKSLIGVEKSVKVHGLARRTDVLVYNKAMRKILKRTPLRLDPMQFAKSAKSLEMKKLNNSQL